MKRRHYLLITLIAIALFIAVHYVPDALADRRTRQYAIEQTGGDPDRGRDAIYGYGCASCHTIAGIRGANALVGPPLSHMGQRVYVAGVIKNTPDNLVRWIQDPPSVDPLTAMPNLKVTDTDARDIAAYLYSNR
jgi:cytochrome c